MSKKATSPLHDLLRDFEPEPPGWMKRVPLWVWAFAAMLFAMAVQTVPPFLHLPLPHGEVIGTNDPDPWLRLTIVRDWLTGGSWYSHLMVNADAPWGGVSSPWTRPLDVVIAILVWLQFHSAPLNIMLIRAALILPNLWMLLMVGGMFRCMHVLKAPPIAIFMSLALIYTMPIMWNYFGEANSDHHSLLAMLWVWVIACQLEENPSRRTIVIGGLLVALMLWISVEAMMLIAMLYLFYGLAWLLDEPLAKRLPTLATVTAVAACAAVLIERPPAEWLSPVYDSISIVQAFALVLCAVVAHMLAATSSRLPSINARLGAAILDVGLLLAILWRVYPLFFRGPMATVNPYILTDFLPRINEAQSLDTENWQYVVAVLTQPLIAMIACITQLRTKAPLYPARVATLLLLLVTTTMALYIVEIRWFYYLYPIVAIALAPWLSALYTPAHPSVARKQPAKWLNAYPVEGQALRRIPILCVVLLLPLVMLYYNPDTETEDSRHSHQCEAETLHLIYDGTLQTLLGEKPVNLLASTDVGGEILFWTNEHIVASNYHREGPSIKYAWEASKVKSDSAMRAYFAKRNIQAVLLCPDSKAPKGSFLESIRAGKRKAPGWFVPVAFQSKAKPLEKPSLFLVKP